MKLHRGRFFGSSMRELQTFISNLDLRGYSFSKEIHDLELTLLDSGEELVGGL